MRESDDRRDKAYNELARMRARLGQQFVIVLCLCALGVVALLLMLDGAAD